MPPALIILVGGDTADDATRSALDLGRRVGGVGRLVLFHPPEAESALTSRSLGYRLWPQQGATPGERYRNAFGQAGELGYDGGVVLRGDAPAMPAERLTEAVALLEEHAGVIIGDGSGGIAALGLQEPQPTLFPGDEVPGYDELVARATQQRIFLVELEAESAVSG